VRTGNISSLSERDWAGVRERRAFEQAERDEQLLAEDRAQYEQQYLRTVEEDQRVAPAHRIAPIPFDAWRAYADPAINDPLIRGAAATNKALLLKVRSDEAAQAEAESKESREAVLAGKPDPSWKIIPASAAGLKMTKDKIQDYVRQQAELFVKHNEEYFRSAANVEAIFKYLSEQGVRIPDEECIKAAWLRLRELGMIEERPAPMLEPTPESQEPQPDPEQLSEQKRNEYRTKVIVTDPRTGQSYTEYQLDRLPADEYKRLMIGEFRTPTIRDVIKPPWHS
jgi:hypothetical protein